MMKSFKQLFSLHAHNTNYKLGQINKLHVHILENNFVPNLQKQRDLTGLICFTCLHTKTDLMDMELICPICTRLKLKIHGFKSTPFQTYFLSWLITNKRKLFKRSQSTESYDRVIIMHFFEHQQQNSNMIEFHYSTAFPWWTISYYDLCYSFAVIPDHQQAISEITVKL